MAIYLSVNFAVQMSEKIKHATTSNVAVFTPVVSWIVVLKYLG